MRIFSLFGLALTVGLMACDNAASDIDSDAKSTRQTAKQMQHPNNGDEAPTADQASASTPPPPKTGQYRLLGIVDPDLNNMVVFALKVPRDWQATQWFRRQWEGSTPHRQIYVGFRSPDGAQQVEYLPARDYLLTDGPMAQQNRQMKQQMGMSDQPSPSEMAPVPALTYLKRFVLPQLAQQGLGLRSLGNEREIAPHPGRTTSNGPPPTESSASVDGVLANGRQVRLEVRLFVARGRIGDDTYVGWSAIPSITQTTGDLAATYVHTKAAQESIVNNPAWEKQNSAMSQQMHQNAMQHNTQFQEQMTAGHNQRMANIAATGAANTARFNERMTAMDQNMANWQTQQASGDRQHEAYVDNVVRNETKFENSATGERVKLDNRYDHAYTDNQGRYYLSNTPIQVSDVNWQELSKVSSNDY